MSSLDVLSRPERRDSDSAARLQIGGFRDLFTPAFLIGAVILLFWIVCAILGPRVVPYDPYADDMLAGLAPPDAAHWFGTDQLGRDVFSRVIVGARDILTVAPLATLLGVGTGAALGLVLGTLGGWVDLVVGRLLDAVMAMPLIVVALMALVALGSSNMTVVAVIGLTYSPLVARTVRTAARAERERDYLAAARLSGAGPLGLMVSEILPNIAHPILIEAVVRLGYASFSVATLSFLGLGIQPPSPDWGLAVSDSYGFLVGGSWWVVAFNAGAIISLVVATNLVADALGAGEI